MILYKTPGDCSIKIRGHITSEMYVIGLFSGLGLVHSFAEANSRRNNVKLDGDCKLSYIAICFCFTVQCV